jgi:hypothetical protein
VAQIVLGLGTSHTPLLSIPGERWSEFAQADRHNPELVFPPDGWLMTFGEAVKGYVSDAARSRQGDDAMFAEQFGRCQRALRTLAKTWAHTRPDVTIIVSDDQDEWLFEQNMPMFSVYWGDSAPVVPWEPGRFGANFDPQIAQFICDGYGDVELDVPVAADLGRHLIEYFAETGFDVAHMRHYEPAYGGTTTRRYSTRSGESQMPRTVLPRPQGLPHGYSFVVKRLLDNQPATILPIFQNTCYPPNVPTPRRCHQFGKAIAEAVRAWPEDATVAIVASGGLSHFVVDEEVDRALLQALTDKDAAALESLPRHRLRSASSESLNWVTVGGAMADLPLTFELLDYVPVYRTEAGTGGGWAFGCWR